MKIAPPLTFPALAVILIASGCGKSDAPPPPAPAAHTNATAAPASTQKPAARPADIGEIKLRAEKGDVDAQVKLANANLMEHKAAEAMKWYRLTADKSVQAQFQMGNLLLYGSRGAPSAAEMVTPNPPEGLKWTYIAATNGYRGAYRNMANALRLGLGCARDRTEAYAWLILLADGGDVADRKEQDGLAIDLSSDEIQKGKLIAEDMKAGNWPPLRAKLAGDAPLVLTLNNITFGRIPLAMINGKTLGEHETITVPKGKETVAVTCMKISSNYVWVSVEGESEPRLLHPR